MDKIARGGICGLMDTIGPGIPPGSDTAHLALLGYDPFEVYTGRGPFEAAGAGIELKPGEIALRVNYATVDDKLKVCDRRAGRIRETKALEAAIKRVRLSGVRFHFKSTTAHRAVLVLRGKGLSHEVTDSDPHKIGIRVPRIKPRVRKAARTAKLLNEFSNKTYKVLKNHPINKKRVKQGLPPANYLLLRGAGVVPHLEPLQKKFGLKGACIAAAALVKGVCRMVGMKVINVPRSTTGVDTDLDSEVKAVLQALKAHDFVLYSIKGFDEVSHDGDFNGKVKFIERVDAVIGKLRGAADYIMLVIDHTTPVSVRDHTGDSVPIVIAGPSVRSDDVETYDERATAKGRLGRIKGKDLLPILVDLMGRGKKFGA
jgi:2,3-bisphosphoglycerate-independent phosphoglycerate mutase